MNRDIKLLIKNYFNNKSINESFFDDIEDDIFTDTVDNTLKLVGELILPDKLINCRTTKEIVEFLFNEIVKYCQTIYDKQNGDHWDFTEIKLYGFYYYRIINSDKFKVVNNRLVSLYTYQEKERIINKICNPDRILDLINHKEVAYSITQKDIDRMKKCNETKKFGAFSKINTFNKLIPRYAAYLVIVYWWNKMYYLTYNDRSLYAWSVLQYAHINENYMLREVYLKDIIATIDASKNILKANNFNI